MVSRYGRRDFILLTAGGALALSCGSGGGSSGDVTMGQAKDIVAATPKIASDGSCVLMRDSGGLYAMSLTCTHAGCDLSGGVGSQQITCGCHGSVFDANGNVLQGPATDPLPHYAVTVDATGVVTVHTGQVVGSSQRTAG